MDQTQKMDKTWNPLYPIAGVGARIIVLYSLTTMVLLLGVGGRPETAQEAFDLLQDNRILGLLRLDALNLLIMPIYYPLFLSLLAGLRKTSLAYASLGGLLAFAGTALFLATPSAFSLVPLSNQYAADAANQDRFLAAGEALLAADMWHSSGAMIGGILMLLAAILFSALMLGSSSFSRATAYFGLLTHGLDLIRSLIGIFYPTVGVIIMAVAGPLYLVWFPLLA